MTIQTRSVFYYGHEIDDTNLYLNFSEGGPEITIQLSIGGYSLTDFATEIATQMTQAGGQEYSVTVDRDTRQLTISATSNFELLVNTGTNVGSSAWSLMGFTGGSDLSGSNSYQGPSGSGKEFAPQFWLQDYVDLNDSQDRVSATVTQSANGTVESVSFGLVRFLEFNCRFQTNINQGSNGPIESDADGVESVRDFLVEITKKNNIEFMKNRDDRATYSKILLESTPASKEKQHP